MIRKGLNVNSEVVSERYVDIKIGSRYTSLTESTPYEWSSQGRVPLIKIGCRVLLDLVYIVRLMVKINNASDIVIQIKSGFGKKDIKMTQRYAYHCSESVRD